MNEETFDIQETQTAQLEKPAKESVKDWLSSDETKAMIAAALPKICTPDRFMRVMMTAAQKNKELLKCTKQSLFEAMMSCAELGIEPDGRRAYLIPFKNSKKGVVECQLQLGYKALVELVLRSGTVSNIHADVVCDNDDFEYDTGEIKRHKIDFRKERGAMYAAYAKATFKDGTTKAEVLSKFEIETIRNRSQAVRAAKRYGKDTPWDTDYNEMAKKTAFKRLSKWLTLSPELRDAIAKDDEAERVQAEVVPEAPKPKLFAIPEVEPEAETAGEVAEEETEASNG